MAGRTAETSIWALSFGLTRWSLGLSAVDTRFGTVIRGLDELQDLAGGSCMQSRCGLPYTVAVGIQMDLLSGVE